MFRKKLVITIDNIIYLVIQYNDMLYYIYIISLSMYWVKRAVFIGFNAVQLYFQDGVLIENMHDLPYLHTDKIGPEVVTCMTAVCLAVKKMLPSHVRCGVQVGLFCNKVNGSKWLTHI